MQKSGDNAEASIIRFLAQHGHLSTGQAKEAQAAAAADSGPSVIDWLAEQQILSHEELARLLAKDLGLSFVDLAAHPIDPAVTSLLREELATRYDVVPLGVDNGTLIIATANPLDREGLRAHCPRSR